MNLNIMINTVMVLKLILILLAIVIFIVSLNLVNICGFLLNRNGLYIGVAADFI